VTLTSGHTVTADDTYLRESIFDPGARIVAGFEPEMPSFRGQVSEEDVVALISYIKSLPAERSAALAADSGSAVR
jgi:cytochrome c oxidase subunit 2